METQRVWFSPVPGKTVDSFDSGTVSDNYDGYTSGFQFTDTDAPFGAQILENTDTNSGSVVGIVSESGLGTYPTEGDIVSGLR